MAGYCTLVLYFHSSAAQENTAAHSCNIQPYCLLTHQIILYIPTVLNKSSEHHGQQLSYMKIGTQVCVSKGLPS